MTKWIKSKDGRFAGSIGDGKTKTPTASPLRGFLTKIGRPAPTDVIPDAWQAYQASQPSTADAYRAASQELDSPTGQFVDDFRAMQLVRHTAEKHAASDAGQVDVLTDAEAAARAGKLKRANLLLEAAAVGRATMTAEGRDDSIWTISSLMPEHDDYDDTLDAITQFRAHASTPLIVPPAGNHPGTTYPHDASRAAEQLRAVADHVISAASERDPLGGRRRYDRPAPREVYSAELVAEARQYVQLSFCASEPGQPDYVRNDYHQFVRRVEEAQANNQALVTSRATALRRAAESVLSHKTSPQPNPWA